MPRAQMNERVADGKALRTAVFLRFSLPPDERHAERCGGTQQRLRDVGKKKTKKSRGKRVHPDPTARVESDAEATRRAMNHTRKNRRIAIRCPEKTSSKPWTLRRPNAASLDQPTNARKKQP